MATDRKSKNKAASGFLPSEHQGVPFRSQGDPILHVSNPAGIDHRNRGELIDSISALNQLRFREVGDPEIEARIDAFQLAYRMQSSVPELMDISAESKSTLEMYGAQPGAASDPEERHQDQGDRARRQGLDTRVQIEPRRVALGDQTLGVCALV